MPNFTKSSGNKNLSEIAKKSKENANTQQIINVDMSKIFFNPKNEETFGMEKAEIETLAEDIKINGFVGCIEVFLNLKEGSGEYEIQAGHKRYVANKLAGNETIPCVIVKKSRRRYISDNTNQRNFNPIQIANCIVEWEEVLKEEGFKGDKRAEISRQMHISSSQVYKYKSLINLIVPLQELLKEEKIPFSSASAIAGIKEKDLQEEILKKFLYYLEQEQELTRNIAEKIIKNVKTPKQEDKEPDAAAPERQEDQGPDAAVPERQKDQRVDTLLKLLKKVEVKVNMGEISLENIILDLISSLELI